MMDRSSSVSHTRCLGLEFRRLRLVFFSLSLEFGVSMSRELKVFRFEVLVISPDRDLYSN